jgi:hypothetical protein
VIYPSKWSKFRPSKPWDRPWLLAGSRAAERPERETEKHWPGWPKPRLWRPGPRGPKAIPSLTRILRWHLERADAELAKPDGGNPDVISQAYTEARSTAAILAPFQAPKLSAVALGRVQKMVVIVKGGLPPRQTEAPAIAPPATGIAGPDDGT